MVASAAGDGRRSLLVVDDDSRVRTVVCWQLEAEGYDVREAADGNTAWAGIVTHRPDLIVLDLSLPGLSGLDLLRRLRGGGDPTPVVVLSGRSGEGDRMMGLDLGADDYLSSPSPRASWPPGCGRCSGAAAGTPYPWLRARAP